METSNLPRTIKHASNFLSFPLSLFFSFTQLDLHTNWWCCHHPSSQTMAQPTSPSPSLPRPASPEYLPKLMVYNTSENPDHRHRAAQTGTNPDGSFIKSGLCGNNITGNCLKIGTMLCNACSTVQVSSSDTKTFRNTRSNVILYSTVARSARLMTGLYTRVAATRHVSSKRSPALILRRPCMQLATTN